MRAGGIIGGTLERGGKRIARLVWEPIHSEPLGSNSGVPLLVSEFSLRGISVRGAVTRQMMLLPTLTSERLIPPEHTIRRVKAVPPG